MSPKLRLICASIVCAIVLGGSTAYVLSRRTPLKTFHAFHGPEQVSDMPKTAIADWRQYSAGGASRLVIYLTDENSAWLGLVNGLKSIGVPFKITDDAAQAVQNDVILVYPLISGRQVPAESLGLLRGHVNNGGTLIATQVLGGGLQDVFGFSGILESRTHFELNFDASEPSLAGFAHPGDLVTRLSNPQRPDTWLGTQTFLEPERVMVRYEDGSAAMVAKTHDQKGNAYAIGFDLGFFILRAQNGRDGGASRQYANGYEPSIDVWLRLLKNLYLRHEPDAIVIGPVPEGRQVTAVMTFDVDFEKSIRNMSAYSEVLADAGIAGTFFIQTKYFRDFFDTGFFNDNAISIVADLSASGMEVASHSVSHSDMFADFKVGTGDENYPAYQPRVLRFGHTRNATILGELRVSKHLLEQATGQAVTSFRPGFLATPSQLGQALQATRYANASTVTAGHVGSFLPYRMMFDRRYSAQTSMFQFPIAIEDELSPSLEHRTAEAIALAHQVSEYGGAFIVLIHPNIRDEKLDFLSGLIPEIADIAWFGTLDAFGAWWRKRDAIEVDVMRTSETATLFVSSLEAIVGVTFTIPEHWQPPATLPDGVAFLPGQLYIADAEGQFNIVFALPPGTFGSTIEPDSSH